MNKKHFLFFFLYFASFFSAYSQYWNELKKGIKIPFGVHSLYSDTTNDYLYIGGDFMTIGSDTMPGIARWDGNQFLQMGCGFDWDCITFNSTFAGPVYAITRYKNDIYAGGAIRKADGKPIKWLAKWDGLSWDSVGTGVNSLVSGLTIINNELYVVGTFCYAGGVLAENLARWDGNLWCGFNSTVDNRIGAVAFYKDTLYVGGGFWTINGDTMDKIAKWSGGDYVDTCGVINSQSEIPNPHSEITISPNPFTDFTNLTIPDFNKYGSTTLTVNKELEFKIYDILGREVRKQKIMSVSTVIYSKDLPQGIYFYKIQNNFEIIHTGKIIINN